MYAKEVAASLIALLEKGGNEYEFDEDKGIIFSDIPLKEIEVKCKLVVYIKEDVILAYGRMGFADLVNEKNLLQMAEILHRINYSHDRGNFELDFSTRTLRYKCTLIITDIFPTDSMLGEALLRVLSAYDKYGIALCRVSLGELTPEAAVEQAEADGKQIQFSAPEEAAPGSAGEHGPAIKRFVFPDGREVDAYFFENGRFGGFSHRGDDSEVDQAEEEDEEREQEKEAALSWQMSVMGEWLRGREQDEYIGKRFAFLKYDPYEEDIFVTLAEEDSVVKLLCTMGMESRGHGNPNPNSWGGYRELPHFIRQGVDNKILGFLLYLQSHFDFYTEQDEYESDAYLEDLTEVLPEATFIAGWSALPPYQDEAYAIVAL